MSGVGGAAGTRALRREGREILLRLVDGDPVDEFWAELDGMSAPTRSSAATDSRELTSWRARLMIVIDEYLAVRVLLGDCPDQLPTDELGLR